MAENHLESLQKDTSALQLASEQLLSDVEQLHTSLIETGTLSMLMGTQ